MINRKRFAINAVANIASGSAAAILALALPPILVRHMSVEAFNLWSLILQLGAYTAVLNLGIQVAVGRFIALHNAKTDALACAKVTSTALVMLWGLAVIALLGMASLAGWLPYIFKQIPPELIASGRTALLIVGGSLALALPFNVYAAIFMGLQRNHVPALVVIVSKLIQGCCLAWAALSNASLIQLSCIFAITNLLQYFLQYVTHALSHHGIRFNLALVNGQTVKEIVAFCSSLTVWTIAMLMISGLGVALVGVFDYKSVGAFTLATSVITFLAGFQTAIFQPLIASAAAASSTQNAQSMGKLLIRATQLGTAMLVISSLTLQASSAPLLNVWIGARLAEQVAPILGVLILGHVIRLSATPYSTMLIATGQQQKILMMPFVEGTVNLICSIVLGQYLGAIGVAWGTVIGSIAGIAGNIAVNFSKTSAYIHFGRREYFINGLYIPIVCASWPFIVYLLFALRSHAPSNTFETLLFSFLCFLLSMATCVLVLKPQMRQQRTNAV
jgi:O-antigen/teichoic acid export membrane protein